MASNTSKTAHVMNLLSKNRGGAAEPAPEPQKETAPQAEAVPQAEPAPAEAQRAAPVAPIISSINADAAVSAQIKDALEAELEETPALAPRQAASVQQTASVQRTAPVQQVPVQEAAPVQPPAPVPVEAPVEDSMDLPVLHDVPPSDGQSYVNVMQLLVEEKADEYMKMFGICCCDMCRVDVRAFALNHLPPKYVVMSENERVPRLTVYENRFASDVTAQLIQACKQVMLTPHHSRNDS